MGAALRAGQDAVPAGHGRAESIVGYQNRSIQSGYTSISPVFVSVSDASVYKVKDIKGEFSEGDSIQIFGSIGDVETEYFYCEQGSLVEGKTGWYADDFETPVGDNDLLAGSEFWFNAQGNAEITISGQVNKNDIVVELSSGFTPVGNCAPVAYVLDDFLFENLAEGDSIQIFDSVGDVLAEYFYCEQGSLVESKTGWYADDFETQAGATPIESGKGFWMNCQSKGATITVPSAL